MLNIGYDIMHNLKKIFKGSSLSICMTDFGKYDLFDHIQV